MPTGGTTGQVLAKSTNANYDTTWVTVGGGGGSGLLPPEILVVSNDMPTDYKSAAATAGATVFVCDGTADEVQIQAAIDLAAPLNGRNSTSPSDAQQRGTVQLTGGRFNIAAPIRMRTGVSLVGMGELTELRAVSLSATTGYPAGVAAVIKQNAVTDHVMTVRSVWINGNFASGSGCHGIAWAGPGGSASDYPDTNPDPSNHIRDVRVSGFTTGTRHGIWISNNCRGGHYSNIWVRNCSGNGFWAESTPDSALSGSDFGGCGTGVRIEGANWRITGNKTYYSGLSGGPGIGFYFGSGRHTITDIESQDDFVGVQLAGIKCAVSGVTVDCARDDGIILSGSRNAVTSLAVYQRDAGRFTTTARGIVFSGATDLQVVGWVQKNGGGSSTITTTITGTYDTTRNFIRIADDSAGSSVVAAG